MRGFLSISISNSNSNSNSNSVLNSFQNILRTKQALRVYLINPKPDWIDPINTPSYSYDIFSSYSYHEKLASKNCRALIVSGDHDGVFPYVGVKEWITSLNLKVEEPWKPFYASESVGGYVMKYTQNNYSLTFATIKGAGHSVAYWKPKESFVLAYGWFSSQTYSSDS
ncbi:serine carboxypeptidase-like 13 [Bidens hawaiensis]|uniref:serine carboxypeptidase-like 13 n=1 Tax=Bidens hawaiensis TaxID=980011 RepID=UPI00404A4FBB